jgi:hypothetical protein
MSNNDKKNLIPPEYTKIILAEGDDDYFFLRNLLKVLTISDIWLFNFEGINHLTKFIETLEETNDNFADLKSILIARDSEDSSVSAIQSVNTSLKATGLIDTEIVPFQFAESSRKIGCMLFPGYDSSGKLYESGTLEILCLNLFAEQDVVKKVDEYLDDFQHCHGGENVFPRIHKNKLHATFSFTDKFVGKTPAQALIMNGYDLESPFLKPFLTMIRGM